MNKQNTTLVTTTSRALLFLAIAIAISALYQLAFVLIRPTIWSDASLLLTICTLVAFVTGGALLASEKNIKSRVVSGATLLVLGIIILRVGHAYVEPSYLLALALAVALGGALPALHRKSTSKKQTVLSILFVAAVAVVLFVSFVYVMGRIDRSALN